MEIGIYMSANIVYLVRELYLGDRIARSFIALALDIHVFCLRVEAEGAILYTARKV